jgi:hypothetical protein
MGYAVATRRRSRRRRNSRRRGFPWVPTLVTGVIVGAIIAVFAYGLGYSETIERRTAKAFLEQYYAQVVNPKTRGEAWNMLTPEFRPAR